MNDINSIFSYAVPSLVTLVSILLTWIIFNKENDKTYLKDRYEKVIFPIFSILEEHLYKKEITDDILTALESCKRIIEENKMIAGGNLLQVFYAPYTKDNFQYLSRLVEKEYDCCCAALGIPLRPLDYKFSCFTTRNVRVFVLVMIKISIPALIFFGLMVYFLFFISNLSTTV